MSGRQSLYGQSLVRNATTLNFADSQEKHWKRDWFSPVKTTAPSAAITPSGTPTPFGDERETPGIEQQKLGFQVKAWIQEINYTPIVDGDDSDVLDLEKAGVVKKELESGLSDDAIRGAVASESVLAGLSKSIDSATDKANEVKELREVKSTATAEDVKPVFEATTEPVTEPTQLATAEPVTEPAAEPAAETTAETTSEATARENVLIEAAGTETTAEPNAETAAETPSKEEVPQSIEPAKQDADGDVVM
jgi:hypothetical protein